MIYTIFKPKDPVDSNYKQLALAKLFGTELKPLEGSSTSHYAVDAENKYCITYSPTLRVITLSTGKYMAMALNLPYDDSDAGISKSYTVSDPSQLNSSVLAASLHTLVAQLQLDE